MGRNRRNTVDRNKRIDSLNKAVDNSLYSLSNHAGQRIRERFIHPVDVRDTLYRGNVSVVLSGGRFAFKYEHKCYKVIIDRRVNRTLRLTRRKPRVITVSYTSKFSNVVEEQSMYFDVDQRKLVTTLTRIYDLLGEGMYGKCNSEIVTEKLESFGLKRSKYIRNNSILSDEPVIDALRNKKTELLKQRDYLMRGCDEMIELKTDYTKARKKKGKIACRRMTLGKESYVLPFTDVNSNSDIRINLVSNMLKNKGLFNIIDLGEFTLLRGSVVDLLMYEYRGHRLLVYAVETNKFKDVVKNVEGSFPSEFAARVAARNLIRDMNYNGYSNGLIDGLLRKLLK